MISARKTTWGLLATAATALLLTLASMRVATADEDAGPAGEIHKVNSSVHIEPGQHTGNVSTVNGSIHISENAVVGQTHTVNGSLHMEAHSTATYLATVNGSIELQDGVHINGAVHSVNGSLNIEDGVEINGDLTNTNGGIHVAAAHIAGSIGTASGSIYLGPNAHIDGGVNMSKDTSWHFGFQQLPRVVIEPGTVVRGKLHFERPVTLYVSDHATIGPVEGAAVRKFSGDHPPE